MNIVLDTNVLIAALSHVERCSTVFEHCVRQHTLITSEFILGDKDLLVIEQFCGIDIVRPSAFAEYEARQIEWGAGHVN